MTCERRADSRGISLVESLIAVVIVGLGLLGLTRLQLNLIRNTGDAAHRVEATRMAQQKLEEMRGMRSGGNAESTSNWRHLVAGEDPARNIGHSTYTRSWTVSGNAADSQRFATVTVRWDDGSGASTNSPSVVLSTALVASDPNDAGRLALPPEGGFVKLSNRRHASVPRSAYALRGLNKGRSVLEERSADGRFMVIDDTTGIVIARCDVRPTDTTRIESECSRQGEALLQGYIESADLADADAIRFNAAQSSMSTRCEVDRAVAASGAAIPNHYRYRCHVPMTVDTRVPAVTPTWQGSLSFPSLTAGIIACRYADEGVPATYTHVSSSLDNQNFLLTAASTCPSGTVLHPST